MLAVPPGGSQVTPGLKGPAEGLWDLVLGYQAAIGVSRRGVGSAQLSESPREGDGQKGNVGGQTEAGLTI